MGLRCSKGGSADLETKEEEEQERPVEPKTATHLEGDVNKETKEEETKKKDTHPAAEPTTVSQDDDEVDADAEETTEKQAEETTEKHEPPVESTTILQDEADGNMGAILSFLSGSQPSAIANDTEEIVDGHDVENPVAPNPNQEAEQHKGDDNDNNLVPEAPANNVQTEEEKQQKIIEGQKQRETQALARDDFCKFQRARYLHKASQTWFEDAFIVGVHYDDGLDKPYYTIVYHPRPEEEPVEKQTTRDRLEHTTWDEAKTRQILSSKGKL